MSEDASEGSKPAEIAVSGATVIREATGGSLLVPIVTAVLLIAIFCTYYFVYVPARREYLTNRNFRALAILGDQIQTNITNYGGILNNFAAHYRDHSGSTWKSFLSSRHQEMSEDEARRRYLQHLAPGLRLREQSNDVKHASDLQVQRRDGRWEMVLMAAAPGRGEQIDFSGSVALDDLLRPFVVSLPFADILVASQSGSIIYEKTKTGPQFTTLASLLENQTDGQALKARADSVTDTPASEAEVALNKDQAWRGKSIHLTEIRLAGTRYRVFLQPILIDVYSGTAKPAKPLEWVLCGLTPSAALDWESLAISYTLIIWITALFFVVCLSGPMLKVFFMNQRERLRLRELAFLGLFLVLLGSVLTLSGLQWFYFHMKDDNTEEQLERLASSLSGNIHHELRQMRKQLQAMCETVELQSDLQKAAKNEVVRSANPAFDPTPVARYYPYLHTLFWTDAAGRQIVKWSTNEFLTPMIDVSQSGFYRHLMHPQGQSLLSLEEDKGPPFDLDSVLPENKLDYVAVLGMGTRDCMAGVKIPSEKGPGGAAFLVAQPLSLIDPILPPGYGFALVDQSGQVLFHNDKTRNLRENFYQESDQNRELYAAMFGHSNTTSIRLTYLGKPYRGRVVPIPGVTQARWSLIVYRDLTPIRTVNLQVMTMASTLFLLLLAVPVMAITAWWAVRRPRWAPEWLLPHKGRLATYSYQIGGYALLVILFLFLGFRASTEGSLIACAVVPYAALAFTYWLYRSKPASDDEGEAGHVSGSLSQALVSRRSFQTLGYRSYYALSVLLLLLLIGVLAPMALFRASLSVERRLGIKRAQLVLAAAVERRQALIHHQCQAGERGRTECEELNPPGGSNPALWSQADLKPLDATKWWFESSSGPGPASSAAGELYSAWFRRIIYMLHHDYNMPAAEMLGLIADRGTSEWEWLSDESTIMLRMHGSDPLGATQSGNDLLIQSNIIAYSWKDGFFALGVAAGVIVLIGSLFWAIARKILLVRTRPLKMTGERRVGQSLREGRNVLVLLPPVSTWQLEEAKWTIYVPAVATGPHWAENLDLGNIPVNTVIEIQQFEYEAQDRELDVQKYVLIERLIQRERTQLVVVMRVSASSQEYGRMFPMLEVVDLRDEPFAWLAEYEGPARDLIWNECRPIPALWPIGTQLAKDLRMATDREKENTDTKDSIAAEILERADAYYRLLWNDCSAQQRFVLAQLAADGVPNPTNERAIRQLMRIGLIVREPHFRIMNESFRRFLLSAATSTLQLEWRRESRQSGWGRVHGAFITILIVVGIFLLTTQNQLWQSSATYVTTALGGLATVFKLFNAFRGGGSAEKAG